MVLTTNNAVTPVCTVLALLVACSAEETPPPETYDWDRSASKLIVSCQRTGDIAPPSASFQYREYGIGFIRLMGDGLLLYSEDAVLAVRQRRLDEEQLIQLLHDISAYRFAGYEDFYGEPGGGLGTTAIEIDLVGYHHRTAAAGEALDNDEVPASLTAAVDALQRAAAGGSAYTPPALLIAAEVVDIEKSTKLDASKVRDWPFEELDLSEGSFFSGEPVIRVEDPAQIEQLLALLPQTDAIIITEDRLFRQREVVYFVVQALVLP